jgi:hypothetical protein
MKALISKLHPKILISLKRLQHVIVIFPSAP